MLQPAVGTWVTATEQVGEFHFLPLQRWPLTEAASSSGEETMEIPSLGNAVMSLTGYQTADENVRLACSTRGHLESVDDIDTVTSRNMSPDLGDMWRQGCPKSPEWEGELELDSAEEEEAAEGDKTSSADEHEGKDLDDYLKQVIEKPLRVLVRDFLLFSRCP